MAFTKENGGIQYAEKVMGELHQQALSFIENRVGDNEIKQALTAYLDFVIKREK